MIARLNLNSLSLYLCLRRSLARSFSLSFCARFVYRTYWANYVCVCMCFETKRCERIKSHHQNCTAYKFPSFCLKFMITLVCSCMYLYLYSYIPCGLHLSLNRHAYTNHAVCIIIMLCELSEVLCNCVWLQNPAHFCTWQTSSFPFSLRLTTLAAIEFPSRSYTVSRTRSPIQAFVFVIVRHRSDLTIYMWYGLNAFVLSYNRNVWP